MASFTKTMLVLLAFVLQCTVPANAQCSTFCGNGRP